MTDRAWAWGIVAVVAIALGALVAGLGTDSDSAPPGDPAASIATSTTRDLSEVTNEEMEAVIEANPDVPGMRLALVERYLREGELARAQIHAEQAAIRTQDLTERARALRYLGWTTALLGQPQQGEALVVESLALEPSNPNSLYFLARIRFELLGNPQGALVPLTQLDGVTMDDEQRALIDALRVQVDAALASTTTSSP